MIQDNIADVLGKIEAVCRRIGREPGDITLIGVTKFADIPQINEAIRCGLVHIGENKVQEARKKFSSLEDSDKKVTRHMIGHLQTNKVKHTLEVFDCIQSVDSLRLANVVEQEASKLKRHINVLVQVNTAQEEQKFGTTPTEVTALIEAIADLKHIRLRGLMTMAPFIDDEAVTRGCFRDLRILRDQISKKFSSAENIEMKYLSMGMTADFEIALEEGSNMVRIGRGIFQ